MYLRRELCIPPSKATGVICKAKPVKNKDELHSVTTFRWTLLSPSQMSRSERHLKGRAAIQQPFLTEKENTAPGKAGMGRNFCNLINSIFKKPSALVLNKKRNILLNSEMLKGFPEKSEPRQGCPLLLVGHQRTEGLRLRDRTEKGEKDNGHFCRWPHCRRRKPKRMYR